MVMTDVNQGKLGEEYREFPILSLQLFCRSKLLKKEKKVFSNFFKNLQFLPLNLE